MERRPILVVDDDLYVRDALSALLETMGFGVVAAVNGRDALDRIDRAAPPCLVVLDLEMPVMDGWGFREALLRDPRLAGIPVVVMSARPGRRPRPPRLAADLPKPVDADELFEAIEQHCDAREWQRP